MLAQIALAAVTIAVWLFARDIPRARLWIAAAVVSFLVSMTGEYLQVSHPAFLTALCDAGVCYAIYFQAREKWEIRLYNIYQFSVLISIFRLCDIIDDHFIYVVILELINWVALGLITGTAVLNRAARHGWMDISRPSHPNIYRIIVSLRAPRETYPWHRCP